jgi:TatD DNase family protein
LANTTERVHGALGLHPELVKSHAHELTDMWRQFKETRFIGEVGLDYVTQEDSERQLQRQVFAEIVEHCDEAHNKVMTVHSRRATSDVIKIIGSGFRGKAILHWFSGTIRELRRATDNGFYFSVNTAMCSSEKGRRLIREMDPARVLTETDGPFVHVGERPAVPDDVSECVAALSHVWRCEPEDANARVLTTWELVLKE